MLLNFSINKLTSSTAMVTRCHRFHHVVVTVLLTISLTTVSSLDFSERDSRSRHPDLQVKSRATVTDANQRMAENEESNLESVVWHIKVSNRQLRSDDLNEASGKPYHESDTDVGENCTSLNHNSSCEFVHAECANHARLIDYLAFVLCDLVNVKVCHLNCVLPCHL